MTSIVTYTPFQSEINKVRDTEVAPLHLFQMPLLGDYGPLMTISEEWSFVKESSPQVKKDSLSS